MLMYLFVYECISFSINFSLYLLDSRKTKLLCVCVCVCSLKSKGEINLNVYDFSFIQNKERRVPSTTFDLIHC